MSRNPLLPLLKSYELALANISVPVHRENNVPKDASMPYVLILEQNAIGIGSFCGSRYRVFTQFDVCSDRHPSQADNIADEVMQAINTVNTDLFWSTEPRFEDIRGLSEVSIAGNVYRKIIRYSNYLIPK